MQSHVPLMSQLMMNSNISNQKINPVQILNKKILEQSKGKAWVQCISTHCANKMLTKQEIRMNYLHESLNKNTQSPMNLMGPYQNQGNAPTQTGKKPTIQLGAPKGLPQNPFMKASSISLGQINPLMNGSSAGSGAGPAIPLMSGMNNLQKNNNYLNSNINPNINNNNNSQNQLGNNNPFMNMNTNLNNQKNINLNNNINQKTMSGLFGNPSLSKQTSFAAFQSNTNIPPLNNNLGINNQNTVGNTMNQPVQSSSFGATPTLSNLGVSGNQGNPNLQVQNTPIFGGSTASFGQINSTNSTPGNIGLNLGNPINTFGQPVNSQINPGGLQTNQQPITNSNINPIINSNPNPNPNPNLIPSISTNPSNPSNFSNPLPNASLQVHNNLSDLIQSKANLWNILCLDPNFRYGYNQYGRLYVKSVLQRIIDEKLLSEQSLSNVIIQIYKKMYGQSYVKDFMLQNNDNKNDFNLYINNKINYDSKDKNIEQIYKQYRQNKINYLLRKQEQERNTQSAFKQNVKTFSQDCYRSFKRTGPCLFTHQQTIKFTNNDDNQQDNSNKQQKQTKQLRKFLQVRRQQNGPKQLKLKFVQSNNNSKKFSHIISTKKSHKQLAYSQLQIKTISDNINMTRKQQRKRIMVTQQDLPIINNYIVTPSLYQLSKLTKHQLLSVPHVSIQNQFAVLTFKAPVSLFKKNIQELVKINQKQVEIFDQQWKVRDAEIKFKQFVDVKQMNQDEIIQFQDKINKWAEENNYQLRDFDKQTGEVVLWV